MLAENNEFLQEAAESLYVANADEVVRQHCLAREDAERRERTQKKKLEDARKELEEAKRKIKEAEAKTIIRLSREFGQAEEYILERLMKELNFSRDKALHLMKET